MYILQFIVLFSIMRSFGTDKIIHFLNNNAIALMPCWTDLPARCVGFMKHFILLFSYDVLVNANSKEKLKTSLLFGKCDSNVRVKKQNHLFALLKKPYSYLCEMCVL